jgi:calcineurin-like phosphoesterase family protein
MQRWDRCHLGSWHLFGHDHTGNLKPVGKSLNVAIHLNDYYPINYTKIKEKLSK